MLLRGLPFDDPDRIVSIGSLDARGRRLGVSRLDFIDSARPPRSYSGLTMFMGAGVNVADEGQARPSSSAAPTSPPTRFR